jgi:hypothetical protein
MLHRAASRGRDICEQGANCSDRAYAGNWSLAIGTGSSHAALTDETGFEGCREDSGFSAEKPPAHLALRG